MKKIYIGLCLLISTPFFAQVNLSSSLTACYALDGSATEPINSLTGTLSAVTSTVNRFSTANTAYAFNGTAASHIELPDDPLLKPTNAISFSCWVKSNVVNNQYIIFTKNAVSSNFEAYTLNFNTATGKLKFRLQKGASGSTTIIDGTSTVTVGSWHHVVGTISTNSLVLYVDGAIDGSGPTSIPFQYVVGKLVILGGSNEGSFNLPLNGSLDNVRFYDRILTPTEVNWMYVNDPVCLGAPPTASFFASPSTGCINSPISLTDLSSGTTTWNWSMPGGAPATSALANPFITYSSFGTYTVTQTVTNSFGYGPPFSQIVNITGPTLNASTSSSLVCVGNSATLTVTGASTYSWSTGQTTPTIIVTPTTSSTYSVVGNSLGCWSSPSSVFINVSLCTGISENNFATHFDIYPNPSSGKFMIASDQKVSDIVVYNLLGESVLKTNDNAHIDISDKPDGVYFIKLNLNGRAVTKKIVKQ